MGLASDSNALHTRAEEWFATGVTSDVGMEFRILGPLDVRIAGESVSLGGAKQRAVLAALLLNANEVISVERLVDEVWGDRSPPSAAHSLEAYVSRIRQLLNGHGPTLVRRGAGYCLDLGAAALDATAFTDYLDDAAEAAADGDQARTSKLAAAALSLWHGPALADVALASAGRAEAERLEELRLRAHELRYDAELELGRHDAPAGELQSLVRQNPYRERFVAQLMLALYRSGRQAEALEAYEHTRRRLDDDLGLQPSLELQQLSGQIVRQEPQLLRPRLDVRDDGARGRAPARGRRMAALVLAASVIASVMAFTASGSVSLGSNGTGANVQRVALVLPRSPEVAIDEPAIRDTAAAFWSTVTARNLQGEIFVSDDVDPSGADLERVVRRLEDGGHALVIVFGGGRTARALAPLVRRSNATRFVFLDASLAAVSLTRVPNATGMPFADHETGHLMGYVAGLVQPRGGHPRDRADVVSIVASRRNLRVERTVQAFRRGVWRAGRTRVTVRVAYVTNEADKSACERLANEQIDAGSDVVYAVAGKCSSPVLAVAKLRGVWGIRANDDPFAYGPHILATTYKRWDQAVGAAMNGFALGTLPRGRDIALGLADDYAVDAWGSGAPESTAVWSRVVRLCTSIREHTVDDAP